MYILYKSFDRTWKFSGKDAGEQRAETKAWQGNAVGGRSFFCFPFG